MANIVKHKTLPAGTDRPGFAGVTPSLYAEEHAFAGGGLGSALVRNSGASDGAAWIQSLVGFLQSSGTDQLPTFSKIAAISSTWFTSLDGSALTNLTAGNLAGTITSSVQDNITRTGTVVSGTWSASFGAVSGANLTNLTAANLTGTIANAVQANITRTGTVTTGTWSASFGAVSGANLTTLTAANITGSHTLPDGVLSTNVPLLNANNAWTATSQTQTQTTSVNVFNFTSTGGTLAIGNDNSIGSIYSTGANYASVFFTNSTGGISIWSTNASAPIRFATNNTLGMTLDSAQKLTVVGVIAGSGNGQHTFGSGGTTTNSSVLVNGSNPAAGGGGFVQFQRNGSAIGLVGSTAAAIGSGTSVDLAIMQQGTGGIGFYTNNSSNMRWGINSVGDLTFGASAHIADSSGAIAVNTGFSSVTGNDYSHIITTGAAASGSMTFGHTFSNVPSVVVTCEGALSGGTAGAVVSSISTGGYTVSTFTSGGATVSKIHVHVRGF